MSNERDFNQLFTAQVLGIKTLLPCCPNCENFDHALERCNLAPDAGRPPARVIAFGCSSFENDVPF
jgi:hypothetical protein